MLCLLRCIPRSYHYSHTHVILLSCSSHTPLHFAFSWIKTTWCREFVYRWIFHCCKVELKYCHSSASGPDPCDYVQCILLLYVSCWGEYVIPGYTKDASDYHDAMLQSVDDFASGESILVQKLDTFSSFIYYSLPHSLRISLAISLHSPSLSLFIPLRLLSSYHSHSLFSFLLVARPIDMLRRHHSTVQSLSLLTVRTKLSLFGWTCISPETSRYSVHALCATHVLFVVYYSLNLLYTNHRTCCILVITLVPSYSRKRHTIVFDSCAALSDHSFAVCDLSLQTSFSWYDKGNIRSAPVDLCRLLPKYHLRVPHGPSGNYFFRPIIITSSSNWPPSIICILFFSNFYFIFSIDFIN